MITIYKQYYPTWLKNCTHSQLIQKYSKYIELQIKIHIVFDNSKKCYYLSIVITGKNEYCTLDDELYYAKNGKYKDDLAFNIKEEFCTIDDLAIFIKYIYDMMNKNKTCNTFTHDYVIYSNLKKIVKTEKAVWNEEEYYSDLKGLNNILDRSNNNLPTNELDHLSRDKKEKIVSIINNGLMKYSSINKKNISLLFKNAIYNI